MLQGTTIEPVARWLHVTSDEAAIPVPLVEPVLLNRLGAEVVQFPVRATDAVVGHPVRELGLPRETLLNVIVRGDRAIPPRGSTIVEAGDQLHMIVRQEVAVEFQDVMRLWRSGPLEAHKRPRPRVLSRPAVTSMRPWEEADGNPGRPTAVAGVEVVDQLRTRRDEPGALVALADGRYAVTGRLLAIGPSGELQGVARRRLVRATSPGERAWWQEVVGALARYVTRSGLEQAALRGGGDGGRAIAHAELLERAQQVRVHRAGTEMQVVGDGGRRPAIGRQEQDLELAGGELAGLHAVAHHSGRDRSASEWRAWIHTPYWA